MRFQTDVGSVEFNDGTLLGDPYLVEFINGYIEVGIPAGCDYWGDIAPSLANEWDAYLTICGALFYLLGREPSVDPVPENPAGYDPEGPGPDTDLKSEEVFLPLA